MKKIYVQSVGLLNHKGKNKSEVFSNKAESESTCCKSNSCCGTEACECSNKKYCCYVKKAADFDPTLSMNPKDAKRVDSAIKQIMHAGKESILDSGFHNNVDFDNVGVYFSNIEAISDGIESNYKKFHKIKKMDPLFLPHSLGHMAVGFFSIEHKLRGPSSAPSCGLLSGLATLKSAMISVEEGLCEGAIAGGSSGNMSDIEMFSLERDNIFKGRIFVEGAAVLSIANEDLSKKTNISPLAELISLDFSFVEQKSEGNDLLEKLVEKALKENNLEKDLVEMIYFNGFSDIEESEKYKNLYSDLYRPIGGHAGLQELSYVINGLHKSGAKSGLYVLVVNGNDNYYAACIFNKF